MSVAFGNCADPYSWLLRGLVEYGWEDLSLTPQNYPQRTGLGFDTTHLLNPMSHYGLRLVALAKDAQGNWYRQDRIYEFEVRLVQDLHQSYGLLLRSDEMAFSKLFPWVDAQPLYGAGYIHEAIAQQVPFFVAKRMRGEGISSIDMQEMLNHPIIQPPPHMVQFIQGRLQYGMDFNGAIQDGLWMSQRMQQHQHVPQVQPEPKIVSSIPTAKPPQLGNNQSSSPNISTITPAQNIQQNWTVGEGADNAQIFMGDRVANQSQSVAMAILKPIAEWLKIMSYIIVLMGILALVNALFTGYMVGSHSTVRDPNQASYMAVIVFSFVIGIFGVIGGWASWYCNRLFAQINMQKPYLTWIPIIVTAFYPLTILVGFPLAGWAFFKWRSAPVQEYLRSLQ